VVAFIERGNRDYGGCDQSTGDAYSSMAPDSLYIQKAKTEYIKRSFTIYGSNLWNSMPEFLKHITTLETFKSAYLHHYFNSTD
jgi:hypothetical protein